MCLCAVPRGPAGNTGVFPGNKFKDQSGESETNPAEGSESREGEAEVICLLLTGRPAERRRVLPLPLPLTWKQVSAFFFFTFFFITGGFTFKEGPSDASSAWCSIHCLSSSSFRAKAKVQCFIENRACEKTSTRPDAQDYKRYLFLCSNR